MILITGSSGFIGTNIVRYFLNRKVKFYGVDLKKNTDTMTIFIPGPFGFRKNKRANYKTNFNKN